MTSFPCAQHVRCFLHFKGNIDRKLQELNIPSSLRSEIIKDTLGSPSQLEHGLVDAESSEELDDQLSKFEPRWNELERPYTSPPFFYPWFIKHCQDITAKYMLSNCHTKAGLGSPSFPYYTNKVESKNKILKDEVEHKKSELTDFMNKMKALFEEQKHEVERSLIGMGEYRLKEDYRYLQVESSTWFKMTLDQHQRNISCFMKAAVEVSSNKCSAENPLSMLQIPSGLKDGMWEKAQDLSLDDSAIVRAPGSKNAWMIKSYSSERPHYVKLSQSGGIASGDQCLPYKSMKICACSTPYAYGPSHTCMGYPVLVWVLFQSHMRIGIPYAYGTV